MYTMDNYQFNAQKFKNHNLSPIENLMMSILGLASETGEIAEAIKHAEFHDHPLDHDNLKKELGDLLWYLTNVCSHYGWSLEDIAQLNIKKLSARYPNGFSAERSLNREENLAKVYDEEEGYTQGVDPR